MEEAVGRDVDNDDVGAEAGITGTFGGEREVEEERVAEEDAVITAGVDANLTAGGRC